MSNDADMQRTAAFLADYASLLLGSGATCIRTEKNTRRMASAFGYGFDISIMPTHVYVWVWGEDESRRDIAVRKTADSGISFHINALLSRLLGARWAVRLVWALFSALGLGGVAALAAWLNSLLARG